MMLLPWFKLATTSLNIGTSATVGGFCSYCLFGGENKEEKQKIDEISLALKKVKRYFEEEEKRTMAEAVAKIKSVENKIEILKRVENCLEEAKKAYESEISKLNWTSIFYYTEIKFKADGCKESS